MGIGQQLQDAGRRLLGRVERIVRNPKNYKRSDERIREDICDRLSVSDQVDPSEVEVSVANGEVTLTGTVQTRYMKFIAEEMTDDVPGVHDVHNQLRVARR
jgi:osmotically-inducible protein OsmY